MAKASPASIRKGALLARLLMLLVLSFVFAVRPALAESVLRDAETETLFRDLSRPIIEAAGMRPENVQIVLLQSNEINAFVAGGQVVYILSETMLTADNVNEIQGIFAHELGHIAGGHVIRSAEGAKVATGITLLSLLLGAAAIAAGAGEAGAGIFAAGQQAAMGKYLAFSRTQEATADAAAVTFLHKAGISGKGMLSFFGKLQNLEFRYGVSQNDGYAYDHPLTGDRIQLLENQFKTDPAWDKPIDPKLEAQFERVKAKLFGYVKDPQRTFTKYPESDRSIPARYARAYAWHKSAYPDKAAAEIDSLLRDKPDDPFFLELKGQVLLESGKPVEALEPLRKAVAEVPDQPLIGALFGHALIATEDEKYFNEARTVLRTAVARDNDNPDAWYQLGIVYEREGDHARASLATAERYNLEGQSQLALLSADQALQGIKTGTPDWIRAQDIAMVSRAEVESKKKDKR